MPGRKTKLTPETQAQIVARIRDGAYDYIAAQAGGIDPDTFYNWLQWGEHGREPYRTFREMVRQARAEARATAEIAVRQDNPLQWLKHTARDKPNEPGWSDLARHVIGSEDGGPLQLVIRVVRDRDRDT
jgi:transposase-like protein